jgi:hypothetical protein
MNEQFDELAKALAQGVSRREALRRIGGGLALALLASLGYRRAWAGSIDCGQFCGARFNARTAKKQFGKCAVSCDDCQAGGGTPCSASPSMGTVTCCSSGQVCLSGQCVTPTCTGGSEEQVGTCLDPNATCVCPEDYFCCATGGHFRCCPKGLICVHDGGQPSCVND